MALGILYPIFDLLNGDYRILGPRGSVFRM